MKTVADQINALKTLATSDLDAKQRSLLFDALVQTLKSESTDVVGELTHGAIAKFTSLKASPKRAFGSVTRPIHNLKSIASTVLKVAKSAKDEIVEHGALGAVKQAASTVTSTVKSVNDLRSEVIGLFTRFAAGDDSGANVRTRASTLGKTVGFTALLLMDRVQKSKSGIKDDAVDLVDGVSKVLSLHPSLLALTALTQLGSSVVRRTMAKIDEGEPAHKFCAEALAIYDVVADLGVDYLMTLKIKGLEEGSELVEVLDADGRGLLHAPLTSDRDREAFATAMRLAQA